ncbi:MAG: Ig-like domain repeat protein [Gemmataceae bacterium]|nr:Ig-like domain repeat protein [Gemmataceae bacterium]
MGVASTPLGNVASVNTPAAYYSEIGGAHNHVTLNAITATNPSANWLYNVQTAFPTWTFNVVADPNDLVLTVSKYVAYGDRYYTYTGIRSPYGEVVGDMVVKTSLPEDAPGAYRWIQVYTTNYSSEGAFQIQNAVDIPAGATTPYYTIGAYVNDHRGFLDQPSRRAVPGITWSGELYFVQETAANTVNVFQTGITWGFQTAARTDGATPTPSGSTDPNPSGFGQQVRAFANVTAPEGISPTGTVTFVNRSNGDQVLGRESLANLLGQPETSMATLENIDVAPGRNKITVIYSGDSNLAGTTKSFWHTFNLPPIPLPMNTSLPFSDANNNAIRVADVDEGDVEVQITLAAAHGTISLSGTTGLSFGFTDANGTGAGDGTADSSMTCRGNISDVQAGLLDLVFTPDLNYRGSASVQLITNDLGNTAANGPLGDDETFDIMVANTAPAAGTPTFNVNHDVTLNVTAANGLVAYCVDSDNDPLSIVAIDGYSSLVGNYSLTTLGGMVVVQADGSFIYNPPDGVTGTDSFTFTVSDGLASATSTATINVINTAPNIGYPVYNVNHDQPLNMTPTYGLLAYISDNDGDALTITAINGSTAAIGNWVTTALGGSIKVEADGSFAYQPPTGIAGQDSFTFTVFDGAGSTNATATINVINTAPNIGYPSYNVTHDQPLNMTPTYGLLAYISDNDGDALTITAINGSTAAIGNWVTTALGGSIKVEADGSFAYQPPTGIAGQDSFDFTVFDGAGSTTATATINVINTAPNIGYPSYSTLVNTVLTADPPLLAYCSDNEDVVLHISRINNQVLVNGSITLTKPNGATITVNDNGTFVYTPAANLAYDDVWTFTVFDGIVEVSANLFIHVGGNA